MCTRVFTFTRHVACDCPHVIAFEILYRAPNPHVRALARLAEPAQCFPFLFSEAFLWLM